MTDRGPAKLTLTGVAATPGGADVLRAVDLEVAAGSTTTVVGPSGAGKTTLLRVIAGLEPTAAGHVRVGDSDLTSVPAHRRGIGVVFQEPRLLPHRSVADNVAFGLEARRVPRAERRAVAARLLDAVGLAGFDDRSVEALSGGEQQRVNLARALAIEPSVLLLDEPLAAVDPERRAELRSLIAQLTAAPTTLHVTHDLAEAAELGDRVAVLLHGTVVQHDVPRAVLERPVDAEAARFVGATTTVRGTVRGGVLCIGDAARDDDDGCTLPGVTGPDGPAAVVVRPEHVLVGEGPLLATVGAASYRGTHTRLRLTLLDGQVIDADVPVPDAPAVGASVHIDLRTAHRLGG